MSILLRILSPEKLLLEKEVAKVELPGAKGRFVVLRGHAPIITALNEGEIAWAVKVDGPWDKLKTGPGFAEVCDDKVNACVER